jgi:Zn-dependent protease
MFGWAKPVPYDPRRLKHPERDSALIAAAGPASNLALALAFGVVARLVPFANFPPDQALMFQMLAGSVVLMNITLAIFNLVPLPPLDGSKVILLIFPRAAATLEHFYTRYGLVAFLAFLFFGVEFIHPLIVGLYRLIL